jgi:taurine dioxygenase
LSIVVRRLSHALGAEIIGVDLTRPVDEGTFREINDLFLLHHVILVRGQSISRDQHIAFARWFGELHLVPERLRPPADGGPEYPAVSMVTNQPADPATGVIGPVIGAVWHSDLAERPRPAAASLLRCVTLPGVGGDTMFANMQQAYADLSAGLQALLAGLEGVYLDRAPDFDVSSPQRYWESRRANPAAAQPVVRTHAESGRKALYVNAETNHFVGMTETESKPIIGYLTQQATRPENVYRHQWQEGDLLIWDNRSVLHLALADYDRTRLRQMERVSVIGDKSGYEYLGPIGPWPAAERPAGT